MRTGGFARPQLVRRVGLGGLVAATLLTGATVAQAGAPDDALVQEVNSRWRGARCRLLFDIPIKKKVDSEGWSRSVWIVPPPERKIRDGALGALMWVSDRSVTRGGVLPTGTTFIAEGWAFKQPKSRDGLFLELRVEGSPVRARFEPRGAFSKGFGAGELTVLDRWVRMDILQVSAADERLVEVPPSSPPPAASPPAAPAAPRTAAAPAGHIELQVLGTATEPLAVSPGQAVVLAITYEVAGVPPGGSVDVLERRSILRGDQVLTTLEATVPRGSGTFRSTQSLTVPATLEPGVLTLRASLHADRAEASGETLFQVRRP